MIDVLLLAPMPDDQAALLDLLPTARRLEPTEQDNLVYHEAEIAATSGTRRYRVIVCQCDVGRPQSTGNATRAIERWQPRYVILVGIAGGVRGEVQLGDVLIADQVVDYEQQKVELAGVQPRDRTYPTSVRLQNVAKNLAQQEWLALSRLPHTTGGTSVVRHGPVATGDSVVAAGGFLAPVRSRWPKLMGVEMEGASVALAVLQSPHRPDFMMVRGVSDLADDQKKVEQEAGWRPYARHIAACYALALVKSGLLPHSRHRALAGARKVISQAGLWLVGLVPVTVAATLLSQRSAVDRLQAGSAGSQSPVGSGSSPSASQAQREIHGAGTRILAAPALNLTARDLLKAEAMSLYIVLQGHFPPGPIFGIRTEGFHFELASIDSHLVLMRNNARVAAQMPTSGTQRYLLVAAWSPTELRIDINGRGERIRTTPTIPPYHLIQWAREHDILPVRKYSTPLALYNEVLTALQGLEDKIRTVGMQGTFWDAQRDGRRTPKGDVDVQAAIHGLLFDIATAKSLQVQLPPTGRSPMGFFVSAPLQDGRMAGVCVEFKGSHTPDLRSAKLRDLKEHMRMRATEFGIFCLLNTEPEAPAEQIGLLRAELIEDGANSGIRARVLVIDVSK